MSNSEWVSDVCNEHIKLSLEIDEVLFSKQSHFQKVEIFQTKSLGRVLVNDGNFMLSEKDEFVYHEMMAHVPLFAHPKPENVLIIGGGDGGTAREVLKHTRVEKCVMVEIDEVVVQACKEFIPKTAECLHGKDQRLELRIEDGIEYVKHTPLKFDVVLVDSTDPIGPAAPLFGPLFYESVKGILNENGVVVSQAESPFLFPEMQNSLVNCLGEVFSKVRVYNYTNTVYPGGAYSFSFACKDKNMEPEKVQGMIPEDNDFRYYHQKLHSAAFVLPKFQEQTHNN